MLTPPYHFSIVACPATSQIQSQDDITTPAQILYRGSIPATRNLPFLKRLGLRTVVYCRKKELKDDDPLVRWSKKRGSELKWVKAEGMSEEKLGMGKNEVGEVIKIILNPASYPLYIADTDGISHTSLVIACLRKLQGWNIESIMNEISRFEPDYEDLPLQNFINTYLTSSDTPFQLPPPPYPTWLWPTGPSVPGPSNPSKSGGRERERTASANGHHSNPNSILPFPHPLTARRHPTMKLTFPPLPPTNSNVQSPQLSAQNPHVALSRVNSTRGSAIRSPESYPSSSSTSTAEQTGLVGAAANILSNGLSRVASAVGSGSGSVSGAGAGTAVGEERSKRLSRNVSFENELAYLEWRSSTNTGHTSPEKLSRQPTNLSSEDMSEHELEEVDPRVPLEQGEGGEGIGVDGYEEDEYEEEEEEDEDEEDEEEEDLQPPSQYISALDLAGF